MSEVEAMSEKVERFIERVVGFVNFWYKVPEDIRHQVEREVKAAIRKYLQKKAGKEDTTE